jgi:predicted peroxiredoxin
MDEWVNAESIVEGVMEYGVKEIIPSTFESEEQKDHWKTNDEITESIKDVIENGVKETKEISNISLMSEFFNVNARRAIRDGVKELQPLPAQDGNRDWGNYYRGKEDRTKPFNEYLDEAIRFGVKEVIEEHHHRRREVLVTIKDGVKETHQDCSNNIARVEGIIRVGKKLDKDGI